MKAIVCEMCSSRDVIKQDGVYICQSCGTKYTAEDAKKLMVEVEGKVDVSGSTVKVDNTQSIDNLRQLARRAKSTGNAANAAKYYEMIVMQQPDDWEANFYSTYYTAAACKIGQIESAAHSVSSVIPFTLQQIKKTLPQSEQKPAYTEIANMVSSLSTAFHDAATAHYYKFMDVAGSEAEYTNRNAETFMMLYVFAENVSKLFGENKLAVEFYQKCYGQKGINKNAVNKAIAALDAGRARENENKEKAEANKKSTQTLKNAIICFALILACGLIGLVAKASYIFWIGAIIFVPIGLGYLISYFKNKAK